MNFETIAALLCFAMLIMLWALAPTEAPSARAIRPVPTAREALA